LITEISLYYDARSKIQQTFQYSLDIFALTHRFFKNESQAIELQ